MEAESEMGGGLRIPVSADINGGDPNFLILHGEFFEEWKFSKLMVLGEWRLLKVGAELQRASPQILIWASNENATQTILFSCSALSHKLPTSLGRVKEAHVAVIRVCVQTSSALSNGRLAASGNSPTASSIDELRQHMHLCAVMFPSALLGRCLSWSLGVCIYLSVSTYH
mmetsp:Transcript_1736/g.6089  ORF Transcript_1736/g.6089 Transcript_1736/m.6089 type:complete len:170 (-) Transcript_1736:312-821(-)